MDERWWKWHSQNTTAKGGKTLKNEMETLAGNSPESGLRWCEFEGISYEFGRHGEISRAKGSPRQLNETKKRWVENPKNKPLDPV
jgi:hypothetical protein